jgi:hypothetical protein
MKIKFNIYSLLALFLILSCEKSSSSVIEEEDDDIIITDQYCIPSITASETSYINYFKINNGTLLNHTSANVGYENITDSSIKLISKGSYKFNFGIGNPTSGSHKRVHIWIDKNHDNDFTDPGEEIFTWDGENTSSDLLFSNKSIGEILEVGSTRMRIAMRSANTEISSISPCDTFTDGEIEDYSIEIITDEYCTPSLSASETSYINYFKIDGGAVLNHSSANNGYENITDKTIKLISNGSYKFNFGIGNPTSGSHKRVHIWIDKNQDSDFTDPGEEVFTWDGQNTSTDLQFSNKSIGEISELGSTRMRIAMRSANSQISSISPCDAFTDGEIEDYSIEIEAEPEPLSKLTPEVTHDLFTGSGTTFATDGVPHTFRIPSLITTTKGTLLAIGDGRLNSNADVPARIDFYIRRSTDNGTTWGDSIVISNTMYGGDACTVVDKTTGRIFIFYAYSQYKNIFGSDGNPESENCLRSRYIYSDDDGLTWSEPVDLTAELYKNGDNSYWASGGTGIQLRNGTLVIPIAVVRSGVIYGSLIYSTDHGETWKRSENNSFDKFDENTIVETNDGRIMVNARNHYGTGTRLVTYTDDLGKTWEQYTFDDTLIDPICQGHITRYTSTIDGFDKDRILFSNPGNTGSRIDGTLRISYDEGKTWAHSKLYQEGSSNYSCITILPDGKIGILYEVNHSLLRFKRFSLEDLTDNTDTYIAN